MRFLTAGESHGKGLVLILDGFPAGVKIDLAKINAELKRRQSGYGRGKRMEIEEDQVELLSGIKDGLTFGAPISLFIKNKDFSLPQLKEINIPRPGHADLVGGLKYGFSDLRLALERASARETATRVALGAICKQFLENFSIEIFSHTVMVGGIWVKENLDPLKAKARLKKSCLNMLDSDAERKIVKLIDKIKEKGDSLGGVFEVIAQGVPPGLGSYSQWDRRIDSLLAAALMSIPGIKAVEIGSGIVNAARFGSEVHDEIYYRQDRGFYRKTNRAGGIEAGVTNGMPVIVRGYMKPIATLKNPLSSVDIKTKVKTKAVVERADVCAVAAAGVVGEAMLSYIITELFLEKFGSDNLKEIKTNYKNFLKKIKNYP